MSPILVVSCILFGMCIQLFAWNIAGKRWAWDKGNDLNQVRFTIVQKFHQTWPRVKIKGAKLHQPKHVLKPSYQFETHSPSGFDVIGDLTDI